MTERNGDLGELGTEQRRPDLDDLDLRGTRELVALMNAEDASVPSAVAAAGAALTAVVELVVDRLSRGGRMVYAGAGTSGRLGALDALELGPTFGLEPGRVLALVAEESLPDRPEGEAEDSQAAGIAAVRAVAVGPGDVVIGITASGRTPYVLGALETAARAGAATAGIVCNPSTPVARLVDVCVELLVGPELISGSTRLKAGTAQKLALNTISTVAMVRLGRVHGNLMVGVQATNAKLRDRALRIVAQATGCDPATARRAIDAAGGEVKTAIVALGAGVGPDPARQRLAAAGGVVRRALEPG